MPGWSNSDRRERLPADWPRRRHRILKRDNWQCQTVMDSGETCGDYATEVDHKQAGDDHEDYNLEAICTWHHARKSSSEGGEAQAKERRRIARSYRRQEKHPGLV